LYCPDLMPSVDSLRSYSRYGYAEYPDGFLAPHGMVPKIQT
jgi:hypothetical protein